jgi:hypothetical protein
VTATDQIRKFDLVWRSMLDEGELTRDSNRQCDACGVVSRSVLVSKSGKCVCADCHNLPSFEGWFGIKTSHPQGDQLLRLPSSPPFTKKFK